MNAAALQQDLSPERHPIRQWHVRNNEKKWVNGTILHYYFFNRNRDGNDGTWNGAAAQKAVVRKAFQTWKDAGIGLEICEVQNREDAEIRIGFMAGGGCWSFIGRDAIDVANDADERTMNFDSDLTTGDGWRDCLLTVGQALGFHDLDANDFAAEPPDQELPPAVVALGQYYFPPLTRHAERELVAGYSSPLALRPGEQGNFRIRPLATRMYTIQLFGDCDSVMVLFEEMGGHALYEEMDGETEFIAGCDSSGKGREASIRVRLHRDREYVLRVRVYFRKISQETAVLLW